ncbi:hypothetical protein H2O64_15445 [Kordia sp. YSTF-M3]|uniref:Dockerin domain-containing protein n=1 Tax=Kordia aestuariivivens TaxID=2759037 RepID=A0ABR7QBW4_9FLAO|nr:hypothetical protein [Kordia aestuariivivens]MBC8756071.1 hypothetical protein [Kordia aestuariivivens]
MKKKLKKLSKSLIAVGIVFATILFSSCETEDMNFDTTDQNIEDSTTNNFTSKMTCDCDTILALDLDLNNDGNFTADDLLHLQVILNYLDFDYDGCIDGPSRTSNTGDFSLWIGNGGVHVPYNFRDYNDDGVTNSNDVAYAFLAIVPQFGAISGDEELCQEDIDCLLAYLVGNLNC